MKCFFATTLLLGWALTGAPASAQIGGPLPVPELENRIPPPLPPPPQPPVINGPLSQSPPPGVIEQPRLNTFGDRVTRCVHQGGRYGLRGDDLDAYTRECANGN